MNRLQNLTEWEARFAGWLRAHGDLRDGAHDLGHFSRVWKTAASINIMEGGPADELVLLAAAYFHDLVALPKNHPERHRSSLLSAEKTALLLAADFPDLPLVAEDLVPRRSGDVALDIDGPGWRSVVRSGGPDHG